MGAGRGGGRASAAQRLSECVAVRFVPSGPVFGASPFGSRCERNIMRLIYSSLLQIVSPANKGCFFFKTCLSWALQQPRRWLTYGINGDWFGWTGGSVPQRSKCERPKCVWLFRRPGFRSGSENTDQEMRRWRVAHLRCENILTQWHMRHISQSQNAISHAPHANVTGPKPVSLALDYLNSTCLVTFQRCPGPLGPCSGSVPSGNLRVLISGATSCTAALRS